MAGLIKLTPEELRTSAQKYSQGAQMVSDILNTLTNEQAVISQNWDGKAFEAFDQQFQELSPKVRQFSELLDSINQQMHGVATNVEDTDSGLASQISVR